MIVFLPLISQATHRVTTTSRICTASHNGVVAVKLPGVHIGGRGLCSGPKDGYGAKTTVIRWHSGIEITSRHTTEVRGIVVRRRVAHSANVRPTAPAGSTCQRFGDVRVDAIAYVLVLLSQVVDELHPFGITRHVPTWGTYTLHTARVIIGGRVISHDRRIVI